jgi:urea transport system ATP-binding protein
MKAGKGWWTTLRARLDQEAQRRIEEVLSLLHLESQAFTAAGELSHGQKQRLEIGMLLIQQPALLLLDEPAAGMTDHETMELAELLNHLRGTCSMMVVEHDMDFVAALAGATGRVTVMAEGRVLADGTLEHVKRDEAVIESYLGR